MDRTKKKDGTTVLTTGLSLNDIKLALHPINEIYMSIDNVNPSTKFGGTWVAWGSGRVPVGVNAADTEFDTVEETGGSKTNTLIATNLPPHAHTIAHTHDMSHNHSSATGNVIGSAAFFVRATAASSLGNITANTAFSGDTGAASTPNSGSGPGTSVAVNNIQPYITCYMWKRTA